ncbi:helix-turn-helix transcriptional regulator [Burkholderia ambifaria]|uniref:helix-turn-helix transcriptional regulator n=1 Tax=Burkholderia ambifaria TaxID=152480 RepID=UPI00158B747C|nr:LuxR family transcriptional regulator [Burkholderia ambifaria]WDR87918.1 LuxR family transcriptional regulator [Burkholderia ambifaria]WDS00646.1 LuxR family transcriptional regulator [Burkholderia ambifaria]
MREASEQVIQWAEGYRKSAPYRCSERVFEMVFEIGSCTCMDEVGRMLIDIGHLAGFDHVCYQEYRMSGGTLKNCRTLSNYPEAWLSLYRDRAYLTIDPIAQHALSSLMPLIWGDRIFATTEQREFRDEGRIYGLNDGVSFPAHSRHGDVACVSFVRQARALDDGDMPCDVPSWGALVANLMLDACRRLEAVQSDAPCLSTRELEILKWVAEGKSTWDISRIVSLTEHGVLHHIRSIMKKFDVPTRRQAVLMASRFGLL